jgi:ribosomal protein L11 methyltransferase
VSVSVPAAGAEEARARFVELCPAGFEEIDRGPVVELVAYTDADGERRFMRAFGELSAVDVEAGWEDRWREFHRPVQVGELWIGQPWQAPPTGGVAVVIDPGRAFGTGAHPSTRLCLELLQRDGVGSCLDVGCGSGVIAIAAVKLGFEPVFAVDVDEHAVETTLRNAAANSVSVQAFRADASADQLPAADVVVANLTHELVERILAHLDCRVAIAAGYLRTDNVQIRHFRHLERLVEDDWAADLLERAAR